MNKRVQVKSITISNDLPITLIAGPCTLESKSHALEIAEALCDITNELNIPFIFKTSFDKANRSSGKSARGIGFEASLPIFEEIQKKCPVLTDVHESYQCEIISKVVDILQIPAYLCRQTDLIIAAAKTGKAINIKKGQFLAPWDMKNVLDKATDEGNNNILLCERGTCFGYNRLISDMRSLPIMAETGYPVIFDATHSVQEPGGQGSSSGGQRQFIETLAKAAVAVGVAGIFIETHENPDNAPSDGPNMVPLKNLKTILKKLISFDKLAKGGC